MSEIRLGLLDMKTHDASWLHALSRSLSPSLAQLSDRMCAVSLSVALSLSLSLSLSLTLTLWSESGERVVKPQFDCM